MQRSLVLLAMVTVVALIAVASASQQASAHDKVHTVSTQVSTAVHHKSTRQDPGSDLGNVNITN